MIKKPTTPSSSLIPESTIPKLLLCAELIKARLAYRVRKKSSSARVDIPRPICQYSLIALFSLSGSDRAFGAPRAVSLEATCSEAMICKD